MRYDLSKGSQGQSSNGMLPPYEIRAVAEFASAHAGRVSKYRYHRGIRMVIMPGIFKETVVVLHSPRTHD